MAQCLRMYPALTEDLNSVLNTQLMVLGSQLPVPPAAQKYDTTGIFLCLYTFVDDTVTHKYTYFQSSKNKSS